MLLTAANILTDNLANIVRRFPSFERLPRFYYELTDILVGVEKLKMSLASVDWASRKIHEVARSYVGKIRTSEVPEPVRKEAFGRLASIIKSINKDLLFLNEARNILRKLPDVQDEPTIVIAGYPNVGKSSFVSKITGASPEVAPYPFTTKGVTIGHFTRDGVRYQVMDTPGLLDRPMSERNDIERQAITAIHVTCVHPGGIKTNIVRNGRIENDVNGNAVSLSKMSADFDKMAGTTAEEAARQIVRAIEKNQKRLLIGADAKGMDLLQRLLPNNYDVVMGVGLKLMERFARR